MMPARGKEKLKKRRFKITRRLRRTTGSEEYKSGVLIGGEEFKAVPDRKRPEDIPPEFVPVREGRRWKCRMCGWCCEQNWRIDLTWSEYDRLKEVLPLNTFALDEASGASHPFFEIDGRCPAFDADERKCTIYEQQCYSCRAFPFLLWPPGELYVCTMCKGVGRGPKIDVGETVEDLIALKEKAGIDVSQYRL